MSGEEKPKSVKIDPQCIQDALRMFLLPIKNDDPQLDFYTMYKQETMEYDTENMKNHNEDLNITLIFAGLFSAISSAFVIDIQSKLQPDSSERSEAYLRAILLSLNRSISPDEDPAAPPEWSGPSKDIVTASEFLYASLLISLLAAFIAMLGKQWLGRYLRHSGGSTIERCGDRQRKFDGIRRWPFWFFIGSLPVMLQIALLLLTCGLCQYTWSVNTSVARVIISFTVIGFVFYLWVVVVGTSSHECPFQTPASITLRYLKDNKTVRRWLSSLSPLISITCRKLLASLSLPNTASLIYATWMDARQAIIPASRRARDTTRRSPPRDPPTSGILSCIRRIARKIGHRVIIPLRQMDRAFGNAKQRLAQEIRRFRPAALLPTSTRDPHHISHNIPGLLVHVWSLRDIQRQNASNAHCVSWVLRYITDPEAIDSAIRLAGTIRWFDGDPDQNPPFDVIVSTFETCFDSTRQLYPGMEDRAYFSARAILQINMRARVQSHRHASKYPIPHISPSSFGKTDHDLRHILWMLRYNTGTSRPTFLFPNGDTVTPTHSLWLSNLFVDLTHAGQNPTLQYYPAYLTIASTNHHATIANILLVWYMFLGGRVEEETVWAVDKSDSLETILSCLSERVMDMIANGSCIQHLGYLFRFLAAWEDRPAILTPMAYQWCSALSGMIIGPRQDSIYPRKARPFRSLPRWIKNVFEELEGGFKGVGPDCDLVHHAGRHRTDLDFNNYVALLFKTLEIGFRMALPGSNQPVVHLDHTPHHDRMFEFAFSSDNDEVIADATSAWIVDRGHQLGGSLIRYFSKRAERTEPFSPRLRQVAIHAIRHTPSSELTELALEAACLLDHLKANANEVGRKDDWVGLLVGVIRSPTGFERLSSHNWHLLGELTMTAGFLGGGVERDMEVMGLLEKAGDSEKLKVWTVIVWMSGPSSGFSAPRDSTEDTWTSKPMEAVERVTLKLSLEQKSALQRFKNLCERRALRGEYRDKLQGICERAQKKLLSLESSPTPKPVHTQPQIPGFQGDDTF